MATQTGTHTVEIRRSIRAPRQRVFEAWTSAAEMKAWHAPGLLTVSHAEVDLRPGGAYRIHMREPNGSEHRVTGIYREVDPPKRVVYTWSWEDDVAVKDTVVTVEFHQRGESTEIVVTHAGLPTDDQRKQHAEGWQGIMEKLESVFAADTH